MSVCHQSELQHIVFIGDKIMLGERNLLWATLYTFLMRQKCYIKAIIE